MIDSSEYSASGYRRSLSKRLLILGFAVVSAFAPAFAADHGNKVAASAEAYERLFSSNYSDDAPGAAILVKKGEEVLFRGAYGLADMELGVAIEPGMVFRLGSITKQFTAVAIMQMVESGDLKLEQTLAEMLPDYPDHYDSRVTLEQLLAHTSGIPSYTGMPEFWQAARQDHSVEDMLDYFDEKELEFKPGTEWRYNNSGYFLLGAILEEVSGKPYAEHMAEKIFRPLGLEQTSYGDPTRVTPGRVEGYQPSDGGYKVAEFISMSAPYAAGSLLSTVDDLATWTDELDRIRRGRSSWLKKETAEQMWTKHRLQDESEVHYGFGWQLGTFEGSPVIHHGGGINGFSTHALWLPDEGVFVAVLSNGHGSDPVMMSVQAAAMAVGKPFRRQPIKISPHVLGRFEGVYVDDEGGERYVRLQDGALTSQRGDGPKLKALPSSGTELFFENSMASISFELGDDGKPTAMWIHRWDQEPERLARLDKALP